MPRTSSSSVARSLGSRSIRDPAHLGGLDPVVQVTASLQKWVRSTRTRAPKPQSYLLCPPVVHHIWDIRDGKWGFCDALSNHNKPRSALDQQGGR